jgi:excisionase family DNA binding protein
MWLEKRAIIMEKLLTPDQVAEFLAVSRKTVYRIINAGKLNAIKVESIIRVPEKSLKEYVDHNQKTANKQPMRKRFSLRGLTSGSTFTDADINEARKEWEKQI